MPTITDATRIVIRVRNTGPFQIGWHKIRTTLGDVMRDNDPDALDRDAIVAALEADAVYELGGGAMPEMMIYRGD